MMRGARVLAAQLSTAVFVRLLALAQQLGLDTERPVYGSDLLDNALDECGMVS
jgi:hypothetical protein